jgi:PhnB protein
MTPQRPLGLGTHIFVPDANAAVAFYSQAFGAAELIRHRLPDGRVLFVELAVGPDKLLLSEEIAELNALAPSSLGGSPVMLLLELDDVDGTFEHAVDMGATVEMPVAEMFWGERYGIVRDPFGNHWALCTRRDAWRTDRGPWSRRVDNPGWSPAAACQPGLGTAPVRTSSAATSRNLVLVRWEAWVRMVNASSSLILCRSIKMPLACSMHARDIIAVRS